MARIDLPHVQRFKDRHGKVRHYFRKPGYKRVALPGLPGSDDFMEAYRAALSAKNTAGEERTKPGSLSALVAAFYQSRDFKDLRPITQGVYRNVLDRFRADHGDKPASALRARHVEAILESKSAGAAQKLRKVLRKLFRWAKAKGLIAENPMLTVEPVKVRKTSGFRAWTDHDIDTFEKTWGPGTRARLALRLLLYTGQRRSDVVRMGRQHVRNGVIRVVQQKTGAELEIDVHPALKAELDLLPKENLTFLMTQEGKPFSPAGFTNWFRERAQEAGLPPGSSPHGLRKAAARMLAEVGCTTHEIASITGHESLKEVERYAKGVNQKRLAARAIAALPHRM